ncbi:MAG: replicative DNA helicase [Firmicutes bacterium]|nr:replicative DNA helicase [Bacillota bacterium]
MSSERIPPHNMEAEQSVLGACMLSKDALYDVLEKVREEDFYNKNHGEIFAAIKSLEKKGSPVDVLTVSDELARRNSLDMVGGRAYVATLSANVPSTTNAGQYAAIVTDSAEMRRLIETAGDIMEQGYSSELPASTILDHAEQQIFEIAQSRNTRDMAKLKDVLADNMALINELADKKGDIIGVPTGFIDLDKMTSGMQKSDLIILAARPSMGKTAFALCVARNAALKGYKVAIFSLEMGKMQLSQRLLSMEAGVDSHRLRTGRLDNNDWMKMSAVMDRLSEADIRIDDTPGITVMGIKNKCRRMKADSGLDLVIIDYLQLMSAEGRVESRQQEVSNLSRNLKQLARELDCPVLVLSQLSRAVESRSDHRPQLADLRESGSIEQDADVVLFLYRDEVYDKETDRPGECEVHISKQRNGPIGVVDVLWQGRYTRFVNKQQGS